MVGLALVGAGVWHLWPHHVRRVTTETWDWIGRPDPSIRIVERRPQFVTWADAQFVDWSGCGDAGTGWGD
jgi:hypothetical protein